MDANLRQHIETTTRKNTVEQKMRELVDLTNVMGNEQAIADGIFLGLIGSHPTLQQSFMRSFVYAMGTYAKQPGDLRNEGARKIAEMIIENYLGSDISLPYV